MANKRRKKAIRKKVTLTAKLKPLNPIDSSVEFAIEREKISQQPPERSRRKKKVPGWLKIELERINR